MSMMRSVADVTLRLLPPCSGLPSPRPPAGGGLRRT
eukprot:CAMPEP_0182886006 /NCGR_PEP_ID=MMETSP0034_2-20130328/19955_1 /TAXON_ID=156128 /ORGANISM="Nephroselmis pyriformis, Strain CCMP717" /LENGTH=35 /DNA_ID= /DNA_START= /DNA_END= /DNA_ORIENTATION=